MNLFIDTNIYLSFYHFTSDDLEELRKLLVAIKNGKIRLYVTNQLKDEFRRNRERKIADAIKQFTKKLLNVQFPNFCKSYPEYEQLKTSVEEMKDKRAGLMTKLKEDIKNDSLDADNLINDLFGTAVEINVSDTIYKNANRRIKLGNPPGKNGSLGDAINWESLLAEVPNNEDLIFITTDIDYASPIDGETFMKFLLEEWARKKLSNIIFYKNLNDYFVSYFPNIKLASELDRSLAVARLSTSPGFAATHYC